MSLNQPIQCITRAIASAFVVFSCAGPLGAAATFSSASPPGARPVPASQRAEFQSLVGAGARLSSLPLRFELNLGQTDPQVRFLSDTPSGQVFLTSGEIVLRVHPGRSGEANKAEARRSASDSAVIRLTILGPNPNARVVGLDPLPGKTNYFLGNDPGKWRTNVPSFRRVKYENIYSGIDLIYYGTQERLEYDFEVSPGADPNQIALSVAGADGVIVDGAGDLVLRTAFGEIRQCAPHIFQQDGAGRREIAGGYVMHRDDTIAFSVASYDASKKLVIDPEFVFSTYFGGTAEDDIHAITVDSAGSVYVAGATYAHDFPTKNPVQATNLHSQSLSAFVTKFSPDGRSLVYSTYLGGSDTFAVDVAVGIVLDSTGAAYVTGAAGSSDFPTKNPIPGVGNGIFVTKLSADGSSLVYSSVLGGSGLDNPRGIVLDSSHNAYIFGDTQSTDFPTVNPTQATSGGGGYRDGFWSIISADGSQLLFSTYVGGNNDDDVRQVHVFPQSGDVWIAGTTQSSNFAGNSTGSPGLYQGYFTRSSPMASLRMETQGPITFHSDPLIDLVTFLIALPEGSFGKEVLLLLLALPGWALQGTAVNPATEPFATQQSTDMEVFVRGACAIVPPATTCSGQASVFIEDAKTLTLKSAVNIADHVPLANAVTRDSQDTVYVTGFAERIEVFPLVDPIQGASGGSTDAYVMVFAPSTRQILFSTFLGGSGHEEANGIALDPQGNIYVAGQTTSPNFPTANAYQATPPAPNGVSIGEGNSFIAKIALRAAPVPCTVDANTLCLNNGRFKVRVNWNVPSQGRNGVGTAVPLTGDTGYFWFFTGANIELVVKVLDARAVNQHFWVFYGALSNVEYTITVTDTITGAVKTYNNADGNLASVADTSAFQASTITPSGLGIAAEAASEDEIETRSAAELYGIYAALTQAPSALTAEAAPCTADSTTLCLNQGRFQLRVDWEVPSQARSGHGTAVPVTGDTGYFWFFTSANIELVIKVLDARGVNQHFWVFYGALSNVKYTITITDMQTGAVKVYNNPDGNLASVADTSAF